MKTAIFISLGAAIGALARYFVGTFIPFAYHQFAWGTFLVNMLGCFLIGIGSQAIEQTWLRQLLIIGFLGSFTTFSGLGLELTNYMQHAQFKLAAVYTLLSIVGGVVLVYLGMFLFKHF